MVCGTLSDVHESQVRDAAVVEATRARSGNNDDLRSDIALARAVVGERELRETGRGQKQEDGRPQSFKTDAQLRALPKLDALRAATAVCNFFRR